MAQNAPSPPPPHSPGPPPTLQLTRTRSPKDRIQDILEGARERAESIGTNSANVSPRLRPLLGRERGLSDPSTSTWPGDLDGHGVVNTQPERVRSLTYLGTAETSPAPRRRSAQSRKPSSHQGHPHHNGASSEAGEHHRERRDQQEGPQWKRRLRYFKSIELENKGSVARDHLALERTFLAWLRTSLAFASIGIAITQLFRLNTSLADKSEQAETLRHLGKPLGTTFLAVSILILLLGYNRYLQGQYWVIKGKFPASRGTIMIVSFIAFSVTVASLIVILAVQSNPL